MSLKVDFLKRLLAGRPYLKFEGLAAQKRGPGHIPYSEAADLLVCVLIQLGSAFERRALASSFESRSLTSP